MVQALYKKYLLCVLVLVGVFSTFERFIFALVLEPIKNELLLTDTQLGLMTGIAFFAFYAIAGVPIARWADRGNRVTISALAVTLCGIMVSLCGLATSFTQLLLVRAGVAVGEAGVMPAGQSLISDYFDRSERPRALAVYITFYTISMVTGYLLGGWLVDSYGWRNTFMIIGIPGLVVGLLAKLTLKEPRSQQHAHYQPAATDLRSSLKVLLQQATFRQILILFCLGYFFNAGVSQWLPTFLIRSYDMSMSEVGVWLALAFGVFGTVGVYLGGYICSRFAANNERWQMQFLAITTVLYGIANAIAYSSNSKYLSLFCISVGAVLMMMNNGPIFAAIQSLVNDRYRSLAVAITFLFGNLVGFGLGPLMLGFVSDALSMTYGDESLRYALLVFTPGTLLMAYYFWKVSMTVEADIRSIELEKSNPTVPHDSGLSKFSSSL